MANKITYVKNEEPAFIKAFKQKTGYKEEPTVDAKREALKYEDEDRSDNEEEKPTVVVLKDGDLTAEEVKHLKKGDLGDDSSDKEGENNEDDDEPAVDGKITFKKPVKRQSETISDLQTSTTKKSKADKVKKKSSAKEVKNSSLLSFDDEEEEEDT